MKLRPEAVEKITTRLDMEITRAVKNWRHFARELKVAPEVIESLKWYGTFSPTANVYDNYITWSLQNQTLQFRR